MKVSFFVPGTPASQGSMRAFSDPRTGRVIVKSQLKTTMPWRRSVAAAALVARGDAKPTSAPVSIQLYFRLLRPAKPSRAYPARPDLDKLIRAVLDALTGVIYCDDSQVVIVIASKEYTMDQPGVMIACKPSHSRTRKGE